MIKHLKRLRKSIYWEWRLFKKYIFWLFPIQYKSAKRSLKRLVKEGHYYPIPFYYDPIHKVGYIVITKVFSTSIQKMMLDIHHISYNEANIHPLHHKKFFVNSAPPPSEMKFSFAVVRNPFTRLVSAYKNQYRKYDFGDFDKSYFGLILGRKKVKNFEDFTRKVCKIPEHLSMGHIASQYCRIYDKYGRCRVKFVAKMETIDDDWSYIQSQTGLPDLPHSNKTEKNNWRDFYTLELAEMVYQRYKIDIETFGYQKEYENLIEYIKNRPEKPKGKNWWEISPLADERYPTN